MATIALDEPRGWIVAWIHGRRDGTEKSAIPWPKMQKRKRPKKVKKRFGKKKLAQHAGGWLRTGAGAARRWAQHRSRGPMLRPGGKEMTLPFWVVSIYVRSLACWGWPGKKN